MRGLLPRLLALAVVVLLGGYFILAQVLHLNLGGGPFDVTLKLARAGGLYENATVTYNGVDVGSVKSIDVEPDGISVALAIDDDARIPSDVDASIRQLSAVGEQYVDLVPASNSPEVLRAGSVIPVTRTTVPVAIGTALDDLGNLLDSLDTKNLDTVQSFLTSGFIGTGPDLRNLITNSQKLTRALQAAQPQTIRLIDDGTPVLKTLKASNKDFAAYTRNLNSLTAQLKGADQDLRRLLSEGPVATGKLADLLVQTREDIAGTLSGFASGSEEVLRYEPQVRKTFQLLPLVALDLRDVSSGGTLRSTLAINTESPVCTYIGAAQIALPTQKTSGVALDRSCSRRAADLLQRGADRAHGPQSP